MTGVPSASTRLFVLLGDPVAHSLSPAFQNAAIRHLGLDAVYIALRCDADTVAPLMRALARAGGGGNVTVPHKAAAARGVDRPSEAVVRTGACNTFWAEDGTVCGDNTDVGGFRHAATGLIGTLRGASVLIVGAGGGAAAAVCALTDAGAAEVTLLNRTSERARRLAERFSGRGTVVRAAAATDDVAGAEFDLVVNASSAALAAEAPPFPLRSPRRAGAALDLVYSPDHTTPFVAGARAAGIPAEDGTAMLLAQGAAAFTLWFGVEAPLDVMREALQSTT
jgi:shikimate dehydrogenase